MLAYATRLLAQSSTPTPAPSPVATPLDWAAAHRQASALLAKMAAVNASVASYRVRVHLDATVQAFISLPLSLDATYYFKQPDKIAVHFDEVPELARRFKDFYASSGTPATWPKQYDIRLLPERPSDPPSTAVLEMMPRQQSNLDRALITVDTVSYGVIGQRWLYRDGSNIKVVQRNDITGEYVLPAHQEADFSFPHYRAHVVAEFGAYTVNLPIPDSVFKQPQ